MEIKKLSGLMLCLIVLAIAAVNAAVDPSAPTSYTVEGNTTSLYPNGSQVNGSRGYIYTVNFTESATSDKWVGFVGHVNGEYALQDASGDALYDWDITTITGEVYATAETYCSSSTDESVDRWCGGIPEWANLVCANSTMIAQDTIEGEEANHNHTSTDEDSYSNTFKSGSEFSNPGFYAGSKHIQDDTSATAGETCFGAYLNYNNTELNPPPATANWTEIVLTDATYQAEGSAGEDEAKGYDIIYAALLMNDSWGYNNQTYDFQIMLPQSGLPGTPARVNYYFYVELI